MSVFSKIGGLSPGRSVFDLSHQIKFDGDMGKLYPVLVEDCVPGDVFNIGNQVVIRFHQPLFAPLLHEVNAYVHYYFVPYRILWADGKLWYGRDGSTAHTGSWEGFLSGGKNGTVVTALPYDGGYGSGNIANVVRGSLYDFLYGVTNEQLGGALTGSDAPVIFPRLAYHRIYNEYYRDETLIDEKGLQNAVLVRAWEADYFTKALPWRQRGTAPAIPVAGMTTADFDFLGTDNLGGKVQTPSGEQVTFDSASGVRALSDIARAVTSGNWADANLDANINDLSRFNTMFSNRNSVDLSLGTSVDMSSLRELVQTQKWLERHARGGMRYTEMLRAHFGLSPRDDRLDRPEFIGGSKQPVIFSEVLQTSQSDTTPQGHLAGHGISASGQRVTKYRVQEFGCIIGLLSVMPRTEYQQGFDRMWLKDTKYDYVWPEFAHLSEQPVYVEEIYAQNTAAGRNRVVFGYQGRYNEYRYRRSRVAGTLASDATGSLDYWHLARQFSSEPGLNEAFVSCNPRDDIYPVPSAPGFIVQVGNNVKVARPLPFIPEPGLIDHF